MRGIVNKTDEHIDAEVFIKNIERAMVNSAQGARVGARGRRDGVRSKASKPARPVVVRVTTVPVAVGNEAGADYVVAVRLASVLDQIEGVKAKLYQINFRADRLDIGGEGMDWPASNQEGRHAG